jgi:cell fate regulator YaaT (PSP1 superfamily)
VEASPGHDIGIVTLTDETARLQMHRKNVNPGKEDIRKIYRKARQSDIDKWMSAISREESALSKTRQAASRLGLKMKVNDVEFQGDETKAIFYYTADERVDFRELIKILAEEFKIRIEMRQIGMRQEASRLGGLGSCGRELCCASWIGSFHSVNTTAARIQQLSPNPQKLAGQCSKLKCCLNYEVEAYADALKAFPDENTVLKTAQGDAVLQKIDVFTQIMWFAYKGKEHEIFPLHLTKVIEMIKLNKSGVQPEKIEGFTQKHEKGSDLTLVVANDDLHRFDKKKKNKPNREKS